MKSGLKKSGRYIFFCDQRSYRRAPDNKHFASDLPTRADTEAFRRKISKHEQRATETLIQNIFDRERVFLKFQRTIFVK